MPIALGGTARKPRGAGTAARYTIVAVTLGGALRVHDFVPRSRANGPGVRAVLWVQGCTLGCPGCFNPSTHSPDGDEVGVRVLADRIVALADSIDGLTVSGGEPLQQLDALTALVTTVRRASSLSILLFTGYDWPEIHATPGTAELLAGVDVVIAGRYDVRQRLARGLLGSANQTVHLLSGRYSAADFAAVPEAELLIAPDGRIVSTGIAPLSFGAMR